MKFWGSVKTGWSKNENYWKPSSWKYYNLWALHPFSLLKISEYLRKHGSIGCFGGSIAMHCYRPVCRGFVLVFIFLISSHARKLNRSSHILILYCAASPHCDLALCPCYLFVKQFLIQPSFSWAFTASWKIHNFPTKFSADSSSPQNSCSFPPLQCFWIGHLSLELVQRWLFQPLTFQEAFGGRIILISPHSFSECPNYLCKPGILKGPVF